MSGTASTIRPAISAVGAEASGTHAATRLRKFANEFLTVALVALIGTLIAASFIMGIGRRMDHKIMFGPLDDTWHLSVAISKDVYGLQGNVGFYKVFLTLQQSLGIEDWNSGPHQANIASLSDGMLLDGQSIRLRRSMTCAVWDRLFREPCRPTEMALALMAAIWWPRSERIWERATSMRRPFASSD